ncbi:MAG: HK97 family phage prohead protease [Bacteroidales bacterium]|jgi:HK97 family phage prohead protease|nr:HK97 family phage prohead protease [Bacteroidales bacterium]
MLKKKKKAEKIEDKKIFGLGEFKASKDEADVYTAVISGIKTDRYGDTVNPEGWDLKNFKKNPVLLWAHDHKIPTVGNATKVWVEGKELMMKFKFAPTPFAQELKMLVDERFLKAFSVGFMAKDYKFNDAGVDFLAQELLECSFVNVPAYAEALMKSVGANSEKYKNFIKDSEGTMNWDGIKKSDYRENLLKEKNGSLAIKEIQINTVDKKVEIEYFDGKKEVKDATDEFIDGVKNIYVAKEDQEEKVIFSKSEFENFKKDLEVKAGKVLSKKNRDLIKSAIGAIEEVLTPLRDLLDATTDEKSTDDEPEENGDLTKTLNFSNFDLKKLDEELEKVLEL